MKPEQFVYWLQGYFELTSSNELSEQQVEIIKDHLALVFKKGTPSYIYSDGTSNSKWVTPDYSDGTSAPKWANTPIYC